MKTIQDLMAKVEESEIFPHHLFEELIDDSRRVECEQYLLNNIDRFQGETNSGINKLIYILGKIGSVESAKTLIAVGEKTKTNPKVLYFVLDAMGNINWKDTSMTSDVKKFLLQVLEEKKEDRGIISTVAYVASNFYPRSIDQDKLNEYSTDYLVKIMV